LLSKTYSIFLLDALLSEWILIPSVLADRVHIRRLPCKFGIAYTTLIQLLKEEDAIGFSSKRFDMFLP
jgi:hypothetical protein